MTHPRLCCSAASQANSSALRVPRAPRPSGSTLYGLLSGLQCNNCKGVQAKAPGFELRWSTRSMRYAGFLSGLAHTFQVPEGVKLQLLTTVHMP